jgi:thiol-disulfide isomerase/thioredoxin
MRILCLAIGFLLLSSSGFAAEVYGIGVALAKHPGGFIVTKVLTNSPVAADGAIAAGDLITAVAQSNAPPVSLEALKYIEDAGAMIRGPKRTVVRLTVVPSVTNSARTKVVSLVRGELRGVAFGGIWLSLTNGARAPDVQFQRLPVKGKERLSDYLGKVVVLEFWATWCGPCLRAMPAVQNQAKRFAARKDVIWMTASVDEGPDIAATRLKAGGWNETRNMWADQSAVAAFGVPQAFQQAQRISCPEPGHDLRNRGVY